MIKLDGKALADEIKSKLKQEIGDIRNTSGSAPGLTVVQVGDDPASQIYVRTKHRVAEKLGIRSQVIVFPENAQHEEVAECISRLNSDDRVNGILVQIPLPGHLDDWALLNQLDPRKDADRFHPRNLGEVMINQTDLFPCTPGGVLRLLDHYDIDLAGRNAVVIGRSFIVGKPLAAMLTNRHATVTLCHSRTRNLDEIVSRSDLVVAAVGKPGIISADMIKPGAVLVDVGINYIENLEDARKLCSESQVRRFARKGYAIAGDIHHSAYEKSSYYTPVPGGVGAMTVAVLMENTLRLFRQQTGN